MKNTQKLLVGFVSTFVAGAVVGILFAPERGNRTRKRILSSGKNIFKKVDYSLEDGKDSLEEIRDVLKSNLNKVTNKIQKITS
jgi:gas vesicle protein